MASFSFERLPVLDNLEIFSSKDESSYFPFHFHDVFCISLITKGVEQLTTEETEVFAVPGDISVTNAGEVHQNRSALSPSYSYKTIYVSPDLLAHLNGSSRIRKFQKVIEDPIVYSNINSLINSHCTNVHSWKNALASLLNYQEKKCETIRKQNRFKYIDTIIDDHKDEKIDIKYLSRLFYLSPYHFIREFKKEKGVPPQTYLMLKRLQNVKKDLSGSASIKEVAWLNGFYDVSHLNYSFKKFFGTTALAYQNSNILH